MLLCSANDISAICSIPTKNITTRLVRTYRCTRTHQSHVLSRLAVARWRSQFWADCTTNISERRFPTGTAGRSGDQDNPHVPVHCRMRAFDRDLIRGGHYGQRPVCRANRPNTWLHRPACKREENPCQLGAVHTWHEADLPARSSIVRFRGWSQRVDATLYPEKERWSVRQCVEVIFEALRHQRKQSFGIAGSAASR